MSCEGAVGAYVGVSVNTISKLNTFQHQQILKRHIHKKFHHFISYEMLILSWNQPTLNDFWTCWCVLHQAAFYAVVSGGLNHKHQTFGSLHLYVFLNLASYKLRQKFLLLLRTIWANAAVLYKPKVIRDYVVWRVISNHICIYAVVSQDAWEICK